MENIFVEFLPPWVLTGMQPAFYDKESGTVIQQTARMYDRVNMLIRMFNKLSKQTKETVEEYIEKFNELYDYVHDYFDNLDVQEEINNKLDAMADDGTLQEIITDYIQSNVAWCFNTVADMKLAENLIDGSYAQTLGFYSINDGGGAIYKISDSGTANEMDVIAVGDGLYATLQPGEVEANVLQFGAYGDDTHTDDTYITRAYNYAIDNNLILKFPRKTYKIDGNLSLKHCIIRCEGTLHNSNPLVIGAYSSGLTVTDVYIYSAGDIQIEGAKDSYFNLVHVQNITMYSDGNDSSNTSQAYNIIDGIRCNSFTINAVNNGWINENLIRIKRCIQSITITGDGTYYHNNNRFENICLEGSTKTITINYGHNNYISYRGESDPVVTIANDPANFGNVIASQYYNLFYREYFGTDSNTTANFVGKENLPNSKIVKILSINTNNIKYLNADLNIDSNGKISGNNKNEYVCSNIDPTKPFTLIVKSNTNSQRVYFYCYDANDEEMEATVRGSTISWNATNKRYQLSSDSKSVIASYYPTEGVSRIKLVITSGNNNHPYEYVEAFIATPYLNFDNYENEVDTSRRFRSSAPTSSSTYWNAGDIIYNSAPSAGGVIGWVCVESGNPGTWKSYGTISS